MREAEYAKPLDGKFKQFLAQKKKTRSAKENMEARADSWVVDDIAKVAREFG